LILPENWKSRLSALAKFSVPKLDALIPVGIDRLPTFSPNVTLFVTFWQSTPKINATLSFIGKVRRKPLVNRKLLGVRRP
jgi:hypothetical protein